MKKLITVLTTLMLFVGVFVPSVSAASPTLRAKSVTTAQTGTLFNVAVSIENNPGFNGLQISAEYDRTVLSLDKTTNGNIFKTIITTSQNKQVVPYEIMWITSDVNFMDVTENGVVVTYTFRVLDSASLGNTTLKFAITDFSDNANTKDFDFVDSEIKVKITKGNVSNSSSPLPSDKPPFVYTSSLEQSLKASSQNSNSSAGAEQTGSTTASQSTVSSGVISQPATQGTTDASKEVSSLWGQVVDAVGSAKDKIPSQENKTEEKSNTSKNIKYPLLAVGLGSVIGVIIKIVAVIKKKKG